MNGSTLLQYGGWLVGFIGVALTFLVGWRKGDIDESALVLGKWKELVEAHQSQITTLNKEISTLRERLAANEQAFSDYRRDNDLEKAEYRKNTEKRIRDLEDENAGLKRAIAQNSQSTVYALGKQDRRNTRQDARMDTIEGNKTELNEHIHKLDEFGHNSTGKGDDEE